MSDATSKNDVLEPPCSKKIKIHEQNDNGVSNIQLELKDFVPEKILNNNTNRKTICIQGTFRDKIGVALVLLEKNAFKEDELNDKGYFSLDTKLRTFFQNDIYGNFECYPRPEINGVKTTVIYPATDKHIAKFSQQEVHIIIETPELYKSLTLPCIEKEQFNLQTMDLQAPLIFIIQDQKNPEHNIEAETIDKDVDAYRKFRERAKERKRRYLDSLTPEELEIKRAKDREYYKSRERSKKKLINELPDEKKEDVRKNWRKYSKAYRQKRKYGSNPPPHADCPQTSNFIVNIQQSGPYLELVPVEIIQMGKNQMD